MSLDILAHHLCLYALQERDENRADYWLHLAMLRVRPSVRKAVGE